MTEVILSIKSSKTIASKAFYTYFFKIRYTILENYLEYLEDYLFLDGFGYSEANPTPTEIKSNENSACNFVKTDQFCSATKQCAEWNYSGATSAFLLKVENVPISPYLLL